MINKILWILVFVMGLSLVYVFFDQKDLIIQIEELESININDQSDSFNKKNNCFSYIGGIIDLYPETLVQEGIYICAKDIFTNKSYCTSEIIKDFNFSGKRGYQLKVPNGEYRLAGIYPQSISDVVELKEFKYARHCTENSCPLKEFVVNCGEERMDMNINTAGSPSLFKEFNIYK